MIEALSQTERDTVLSSLRGWSYDTERSALHRVIDLADFAEAFALMTRIALEAEKNDHHPEWSNVYNRLEIWLTTHDAGGISTRDVAMAQTIDRLVAR